MTFTGNGIAVLSEVRQVGGRCGHRAAFAEQSTGAKDH